MNSYIEDNKKNKLLRKCQVILVHVYREKRAERREERDTCSPGANPKKPLVLGSAIASFFLSFLPLLEPETDINPKLHLSNL